MRYPFFCANGHTADVVLPMKDRNTPQLCEICMEPSTRLLAVPLAIIWQGRWHDQWRDKPGGQDDGLGPLAE